VRETSRVSLTRQRDEMERWRAILRAMRRSTSRRITVPLRALRRVAGTRQR